MQYQTSQAYDASRQVYTAPPSQSRYLSQRMRFGGSFPGTTYAETEMCPPPRAGESDKQGDVKPVHGDEEGKHEHGHDYTHSDEPYNTAQGAYNYNTNSAEFSGDVHDQLGSSPRQNGSGRATPRTGAANGAYYPSQLLHAKSLPLPNKRVRELLDDEADDGLKRQKTGLESSDISHSIRKSRGLLDGRPQSKQHSEAKVSSMEQQSLLIESQGSCRGYDKSSPSSVTVRDDRSDYSTLADSSDMFSPSAPPELDRDARKKILLDRLMNYFFTFLAARSPLPGLHQTANGEPSSQPRDGQGDWIGRTSAVAEKSSLDGQKRSRAEKQHESDGEDGDEGDEERPRKRVRIRQGDPSRTLFACPYFKRNRRKYQQWRSCPGPGWATVHRVKYDSQLLSRFEFGKAQARSLRIMGGVKDSSPSTHALYASR